MSQQKARKNSFKKAVNLRKGTNAPMRILLADNHVLVRQGLKGLLEKNGYAVVVEASDGQQVLRLLQEAHFDIAILDVSMPILNGIDTVRELTRSATTSRRKSTRKGSKRRSKFAASVAWVFADRDRS